MSNERTDEFLSWRGRLDQPDALSEQGLDTHEASWQRLAERLGEKPRRRMTGYWVAAACLLLVLIPAVRLFHPRSPTIALRPSASALRSSATALQPATRQATPIQKVMAGSPAEEHPVTPAPVVSRRRSASPRVVPVLSVVPTPPPALIPGPEITPATDSHRLMAALPAPRKQLKVVYYNEISHPSGPSPSTASRIPSFLKLGIAHSGSPVTTGEPVESDNNPSFTIQLMPQNH